MSIAQVLAAHRKAEAGVNGVLSYGAYLPFCRLRRQAIGEALGSGGGGGARAVASYDEDSTSMGVEAARLSLRGLPPAATPRRLYFATTSPAYVDKTNATAVHAALGLPSSSSAFDLVGSVRSGVGALLAAADAPEPTLAVLADLRGGLPGSADERDGGDGAAALLFGPGTPEAPVIAELLAAASATEEFLDRWRLPGAPSSRVWEERFGEGVYSRLAEQSYADALKQADLTPGQVDHLVVTGTHARAARAFAKGAGVRPEALADDLARSVGNTGTAHPALLLADVLDRAEPDQTVVVVVVSDGVTTLVLRTTGALPGRRPARTVAAQLAAGDDGLRYHDYLTWRGQLDREPPRRPDPAAPAAPPSSRNVAWKFGFTASRCLDCATRHLPPARVCMTCASVDRMAPERLADVPATVATFTVDRLAFTPSPPLVAAVVDFDGGGRLKLQLTDVDPAAVAIGDRVEMTFRRMVTAGGVHNYFWKARPVAGAPTNAKAA